LVNSNFSTAEEKIAEKMRHFKILIICSSIFIALGCHPDSASKRAYPVRRSNAVLESIQIIQKIEINNQNRNALPLLQRIHYYLGTPYRFGGNSRRGMDCSGFVTTVFRESYNLRLERSAEQIYLQCQKISNENLSKGDLVFFGDRANQQIGHVGIFLGEDYFAHASVNRGVIISQMEEEYYRTRYQGGGRVIGLE
jgi:cell wall-associated NlpC family hydrolase